MSNIVAMRCSKGHGWILPAASTSFVMIPQHCPKCIKEPNTKIAATVTFDDNDSPNIIVDKE